MLPCSQGEWRQADDGKGPRQVRPSHGLEPILLKSLMEVISQSPKRRENMAIG